MGINPEWENQATRPLLEFVLQGGSTDSEESLISSFLEWDRWSEPADVPARELSEVALEGLLKNNLILVQDAEFRVSERGRQFLSGELSASAIERDE